MLIWRVLVLLVGEGEGMICLWFKLIFSEIDFFVFVVGLIFIVVIGILFLMEFLLEVIIWDVELRFVGVFGFFFCSW